MHVASCQNTVTPDYEGEYRALSGVIIYLPTLTWFLAGPSIHLYYLSLEIQSYLIRSCSFSICFGDPNTFPGGVWMCGKILQKTFKPWPFYSPFGGHLTIEKGSRFTIPRRSLWITKVVLVVSPSVWYCAKLWSQAQFKCALVCAYHLDWSPLAPDQKKDELWILYLISDNIKVNICQLQT